MFKKNREWIKRGLCIAMAGAMILCTDAAGFASQLPQEAANSLQQKTAAEQRETDQPQRNGTVLDDPAFGPDTENTERTELAEGTNTEDPAEPTEELKDPTEPTEPTEPADSAGTEGIEPEEPEDVTEPADPVGTEGTEPEDVTEPTEPAEPADPWETETQEPDEGVLDLDQDMKGEAPSGKRIELDGAAASIVTEIGDTIELPKYKVYASDGTLIDAVIASGMVQWTGDDMGTVTLNAAANTVTAAKAGVAYLKLQLTDSKEFVPYRVMVRPKAPGRASVVSSGYNSVKLRWDKAADAHGYVIYRKAAQDSDYTEIAKVKGGEVIEYLDQSNLLTGTQYGYRIKSYVSFTDEHHVVHEEESTGHAVLQVTPELGKTELKSVTSGSYNSASITWANLAGADGYAIYRSAGNSTKYQEIKNVASGVTAYTDKTLTTGQSYSYKVCGYRNVNGNRVFGVDSEAYSVRPMPATPDLKAKAGDYKSVKLSWTKLGGVSGYRIYRTEAGKDSFKKIKTITSGSTTSYTDKSVKTGVKYTYRIRAYRKADGKDVWGDYSKEKTVTVTMTAPKVSLSKGTYNSITVNWKNVSGAQGFKILRADSAEGDYETIKTIGNTKTLSFQDTKLKTGKTYYYKVRAYRRDDGKSLNGTLSEAVSQKIVPGAVSVSSEAAGATAVKLTWTKASLPSSNSGYMIYQVAPGGSVKVKNCNSKTFSYTVKNLTAGTKYTYKVVAYVKDKKYGTVKGADSNLLAVEPKLLTVTIKSVEPSSYGSLKLIWNTSAAGDEDHYIVYRSTKKDSGFKEIKTVKKSSGKKEFSYTDKGLSIGRTYYYKIVCSKKLSNGKVMKSANSKVKSAKAAPQATTVKLTAHQYNSIKVTWKKLKGTSSGKYVDGYVIYRSTKKDGSYKKIKTISNGKTSNYTDTGLKTGETYYYKVRGYVMVKKDKVYGPYSKPVSQKTVPAKASIKAESADYISILVSWNNVKGSNGYSIYRSGSETGKYKKVGSVSSKKLSFKDTKLKTGTSYYYKVRAYTNKNGKKVYGAYSDVKYAAPVLGTPKNLRAQGADNNQIKLTWDAVAGADTYTILRGKSESGPYYIASEICDTNSFLDGNAKVGVTYYYKVYAVRGGVKGGVTDCVTSMASSLTLNVSEVTIRTGSNIKVIATVKPTAPVMWSSDNTAVALVGSDGTIYGLKQGKTTIRAVSNGNTKEVAVTVKNKLDAKGIDISSGNGKVDFHAVRAAGYEYAMIRITTGTTQDASFETNYANAKAAGLKVGVYCYGMARTTAEAQAEADKVLSILNGRSLDYPIVYHMEDVNQITGLNNTDRTNLMLTFKNRLAFLNKQYKFALYATLGWLNNNYDNRSLAGIDLWVAFYRDQKLGHGYKGAGNVVMWQYTNDGKVTGVTGQVGVSLSYKIY